MWTGARKIEERARETMVRRTEGAADGNGLPAAGGEVLYAICLSVAAGLRLKKEKVWQISFQSRGARHKRARSTNAKRHLRMRLCINLSDDFCGKLKE